LQAATAIAATAVLTEKFGGRVLKKLGPAFKQLQDAVERWNRLPSAHLRERMSAEVGPALQKLEKEVIDVLEASAGRDLSAEQLKKLDDYIKAELKRLDEVAEKLAKEASSNVGQRIGTRRLPDDGLPWQKYQRHVTGRNYEEVWQLSQRRMATDGRRAGYFVEVKWTGKDDAAWRSSPYNPSHEFYDEERILAQVRGYLELHSAVGSKGIRFAVSNDAARRHLEQLFETHFEEHVESGLLRVIHVPGTGM
jgi:hypothetical protein